ncbi:MAG: glycosyltransferase family 1 protein [Bryobacterales bacterium]
MPARLRIGVNALYLIPGGVGGTEIYLRNLLSALARIDRRNQYFVFTNRETGPDLCPQAGNFEIVTGKVPARFRPLRLLWEQSVLPAQASRLEIDVMFSPGFTSPLICRGAGVTVIHDLQHRKQPENFGAFERRAWDFFVWGSVKRSRRVVTVSESSRRDIIEAYGVDPAHVRVVRHGVESDFLNLQGNPRYGEDLLRKAGVPEGRYLLAVSTVHPHKNWQRLLEAYAHLLREGRREHLVVAGLAGKAWQDLNNRLLDAELAGRVHLLGWQPREVLLSLFRFAEALVFPSTFEGFGMPVLEAMAAGIPVVCSDIPPLREIADGAAHFFDPSSSPALTDALREMFADKALREQFVERGIERAKQFTWTRAAEETLAVLLEAARR